MLDITAAIDSAQLMPLIKTSGFIATFWLDSSLLCFENYFPAESTKYFSSTITLIKGKGCELVRKKGLSVEVLSKTSAKIRQVPMH